MIVYAVQIQRRHLKLITALNNGGEPDVSVTRGKHWLVFGVEDDGSDLTVPEIMREREMFETYDIAGSFPTFMKLKRWKGD